MSDAAFTSVACGQLLKQLRDDRPLYRAVALWRTSKSYLVGIRQDLGAPIRDAKAKSCDAFSVGIGRLLKASHPTLWSLCDTCKGTSSDCPSCGGAGFSMTYEYPVFCR
jgi:hypothetical protein